MRRIALLAAVIAAVMLVPPATTAAAADWTWPVRGDVVTPYRNGDDPYAGGQHRGIDVAAPVGAAVASATAGRVNYVGVAGSSGLTVSVRTGDGRFDVSYLHLSATSVREGDSVGRGDGIGAVGVSGRRSVERPHLHFGVRDAGSDHGYRNPLDFLPPLAPPAGRPEPPSVAPAPAPVVAPPARSQGAVAAPAPLGAAAVAALPSAAPASVPSAPAHGAGPSSADGASLDSPRRAPSIAGAPEPASAPHRASNAAGRGAAVDERAPAVSRTADGSGALGRAPAAAGDRAHPAGPAIRTPRPAAGAADEAGGLDIGSLIAFVGLLAAALCLWRPDAPRRAVRGSRTAVAGLVRPLLGRS
jgi:hypothetical protein